MSKPCIFQCVTCNKTKKIENGKQSTHSPTYTLCNALTIWWLHGKWLAIHEDKKKEWFFNLNFMLVHCMGTRIRDGLCTVWICLSNTKVRTCFFTFRNGVIWQSHTYWTIKGFNTNQLFTRRRQNIPQMKLMKFLVKANSICWLSKKTYSF